MAKKSEAYYDEQEQAIHDKEVADRNWAADYAKKKGYVLPGSGKLAKVTESGGEAEDDSDEE